MYKLRELVLYSFRRKLKFKFDRDPRRVSMKKSHRIKNDSEACAVSNECTVEKANLDGDRLNFYLLILLYIIQGFPVGLCSAFPIILQSKNSITYEDQVSKSCSDHLKVKILLQKINILHNEICGF